MSHRMQFNASSVILPSQLQLKTRKCLTTKMMRPSDEGKDIIQEFDSLNFNEDNEKMELIVGVNDQREAKSGTPFVVHVEDVYPHPQYKGAGQHDIALIKTKESLIVKFIMESHQR